MELAMRFASGLNDAYGVDLAMCFASSLNDKVNGSPERSLESGAIGKKLLRGSRDAAKTDVGRQPYDSEVTLDSSDRSRHFQFVTGPVRKLV
jgi:hypothetical protein